MFPYILRVKVFVALLLSLFVCTPVSAQVIGEVIHSFDTVLEVTQDGTLHVEERIVYDFGTNARHGIYRDIPLPRVGIGEEPLKLRITGVEVDGGPGIWKPENSDSFARTRIGDPGAVITGEHVYVIRYEAQNAVSHLADLDEIYWNATGDRWLVPIERASSRVTVPGEVLQAASYCGASGSTMRCSALEFFDEDRGTVSFSNEQVLTPGEGMTVAVGFPRDLIARPTATESVLRMLLDFWFLIVPLPVVFICMGGAFSYALRRRAFYTRRPITVEYDAGEFSPLETAVINTGGVEKSALAAELIWFAVQGYLRFEYENGEYRFVRTEKTDIDLDSYDQDLLRGVSGKTQSELINTFYTTAQKASHATIETLRERGYITRSRIFGSMSVPPKAWPLLGAFLAINPGLFVWLLAGYKAGIAFTITAVLIGILGYVLRARMNKLTLQGFEAERSLLGLYRYIDVAEKRRIEFHNAPEKTPETFERLLPYAMIFGLEKKWAKEFEGMMVDPDWYRGPEHSALGTMAFVSSLDSFSRQTAAALTSSPQSSSGGGSGSSGGGSSGGGGGGGGGGSW